MHDWHAFAGHELRHMSALVEFKALHARLPTLLQWACFLLGTRCSKSQNFDLRSACFYISCKLAPMQNCCFWNLLFLCAGRREFVSSAKRGRSSLRVGAGAARRELAAQSSRPKTRRPSTKCAAVTTAHVAPSGTWTSMRPGICGASASTCSPTVRGRRSSATGRCCRLPDRSSPVFKLDTCLYLHLYTSRNFSLLQDLLCIRVYSSAAGPWLWTLVQSCVEVCSLRMHKLAKAILRVNMKPGVSIAGPESSASSGRAGSHARARPTDT